MDDLKRIKKHFKEYTSLAPSQIQWLIQRVDSLTVHSQELEKLACHLLDSRRLENEEEIQPD